MNKEIKEILNSMKDISSFDYTTDWFELDYENTKILYDYITNLQKENKQLKELTKDKSYCNECEFKKENNKLLQKSYSDDVRITKAIEYIEENLKSYRLPNTIKDVRYVDFYELLNILKGEE